MELTKILGLRCLVKRTPDLAWDTDYLINVKEIMILIELGPFEISEVFNLVNKVFWKPYELGYLLIGSEA